MTIKTFCKYSGAIVASTNQFNNFSKVNRNHGKQLVATTHPIMELGIKPLLELGTDKPLSRYTATERHILFVALARYTNTLDIRFPITTATLSPRKCEELLPELLEACLNISLNLPLWEMEVVKALPVTRITESNRNTVDLETWLRVLILPATKELSYAVCSPAGVNLARPTNIGLQLKTPTELELEQALKADLNNWKDSNKRNAYTRDLAVWACNKYQNGTGTILDKATRTRISFLLNSPIEKVKDVRELEQLKRQLAPVLPREDGNNNHDRTNTILILRHLDSRIEYFDTLSSILGGSIDEIDSELPEDIGISYTIKQVNTTKAEPTLPADKVKRTPEQNAALAKRNPLLAQLFAMKKGA